MKAREVGVENEYPRKHQFLYMFDLVYYIDHNRRDMCELLHARVKHFTIYYAIF